ncbi:MAG TPA: DUF192 domain-containing protein [Fimbriimonadaceae bacterium]|nr:DUF192 domain-containing protein [Fimbriimonadaceae bacterium]
MKTLTTVALVVFAAFAGSQAGFKYRNNPKRLYQLAEIKREKVKVGSASLNAWIMDTGAKRQEGMMFLTDKEVQANDAMLFVFPDEAARSFWMSNTLIPLDIAYISKSKKVVSVHTMKALDETGVPSAKPAMYALEMKKGAFKRLGIKVGQTLTVPPTVVGR